MKDFFDKLFAWVKANMLISIIAVIAFIFFFAGRRLRRLFSGRRVRRRVTRNAPRTRSRKRSRKPLPRSVGTSKRGYPKAGGGIIPFKRNKDGTIKKAWQVAGTVAAKSRMSRLRRARA